MGINNSQMDVGIYRKNLFDTCNKLIAKLSENM